ncbi:MAG TPA: Do family serine endopeptidase [Pyrinomonadaceae bacterium]|jgi:Do/DeqQ family serine protease
MSSFKVSAGRLPGPAAFKSFLAASALALSLGGVGESRASAPAEPAATQDVTAGAQGPAVTSYAGVVKRVAPAVVTINAQRRASARQESPFGDNPLLEEFFGRRERQQPRRPRPERRATALGSGVIVSADGYILTNHHVVEGAEQIKVELNDGRTLDAQVVGSDEPSDLAVLKVKGGNLPTLRLGDSDKVEVGDVVLAVGNPLGIGQTVTTGIISAKGRQTGAGDGSFEDFLQTDAPINQGNSGGALVNTSGELIGINSQILSRSGGSIGIGFAIPSNMAGDVMGQLVRSGEVRRGQLGVVVQKVTSDMADSLGLGGARGVIVSQVQPGSAAERAGLRRGDVITALNGAAVNDPNAFRNRVAGVQPGTEARLDLVREGRETQARAVLGEFKFEKARAEVEDEPAQAPAKGDTGKLGLGVEPVTPQASGRFGLPAATRGLVVTQVDADGPAADAGLERGDVIVEVNQRAVGTAAELKAAVERTGSRPALLLVNRRGSDVYMTVTPRQ